MYDHRQVPQHIPKHIKQSLEQLIFSRRQEQQQQRFSSAAERRQYLAKRLQNLYQSQHGGKKRGRNMHKGYDEACPQAWKAQGFPREAWQASHLWTSVRIS
jgi:hypothetical protein